MLTLVSKASRGHFARLYPTTLVFKDGSTISIRYPEPQQLLKIPLTLEDCSTTAEKTSWQIRRRELKQQQLNEELDKVEFNPRKYLKPRGPSSRQR